MHDPYFGPAVVNLDHLAWFDHDVEFREPNSVVNAAQEEKAVDVLEVLPPRSKILALGVFSPWCTQ